MPKEKDAPRRMMRDAAGNEYPARYFKGWVEESTYDALKDAAAANRRSIAEEIRQLMRDAVENNGGK